MKVLTCDICDGMLLKDVKISDLKKFQKRLHTTFNSTKIQSAKAKLNKQLQRYHVKK